MTVRVGQVCHKVLRRHSEVGTMRPTLVALTILLLAAPLALAQEHGHETGDGVALVLHDGPDSGRAVVGGLTHFGFVLLAPEGAPAPHRNAEFLVMQNGVVLFATNDTHEYDGHFSFDYVFAQPGTYQVMAMSDKMNMTVFQGEAVAPVNATEATILFEKGSSPQANAVAGKLSILDANGQLLEHTDALVEFRAPGSGKLAARFRLHIHDAPMEFTQALPSTPASMDFDMQVVAYRTFATGRSDDFRAITTTIPVTVGLAPTLAAPANPGMPPLLEPTGEKTTKGNLTLYGMYDAQNQIGLGNPLRFVGVIEQDGKILPHVDFALTVNGPRGLVFDSKSFHEYDGVLEYEFVPSLVGFYDATLTADTGDEQLTIPFHAQVLPPIVPLGQSPGVGKVSIAGFQEAVVGVASELTFTVSGPAGPVQHSEVDVTIYHADEAPIYNFKLHTHGSGDTRAVVIFPHAAEWIIRVDPLTTSPDPTIFLDAPIFKATLEGEWVVPEVISASVVPDVPAKVPGVGIVTALGAALMLALARRRA